MVFADYGVNFNGRRIVHPGAYERQDASAMVVSTGGSVNVPIVIGTAEAGEPGKIHWFTDAGSARNYLRGGELVTALEMMFSPAPEGGGGASTIGVMVVNEGAKATLSADGITYNSKEFGEGGNRVQVRMEDGTIEGSKKLTVYRWDLNMMEIYDNLGIPISLKYSGEQAYAGVTVSGDENSKTLTIKAGSDESTAVEDLNLDLKQFTSVADLVSHINTISDYEAGIPNPNSRGVNPSLLEEVANVDITEKGYLSSFKADIEHQVSSYSELIDVEVAGTVSVDDNFVRLTGGLQGNAPNSWVEYFDILKGQYCDILVVLSDSTTIHAEALAHVQQMEQRNQKQTLFTGGAVGESIAETKNRASFLNSRRAVLAYPGVYYGGSGEPLAPYFTAAMIAGRVAGVDPSEPVTFDNFNLIGLENDLLAGSAEVNELITSGVATLERVQNGRIRLVEGITTYIGSNNSLYRQISVSRGADDLSNKMLDRLESSFLGAKGISTTPSSVRTEVIDLLEEEKRAGNIFDYKENSILVRFVESVVYVDYQVAPVEPINFILVTSHFVPESAISANEDNLI